MHDANESLSRLGDEVKRLREARDLTQSELARRLGTSRNAVSLIEQGKTRRPDDATLQGIELHLGLPRQRAYELMGAVPPAEEADLLARFQQIAALPDYDDRMARWHALPDALWGPLLQFFEDQVRALAQESRQRQQTAAALVDRSS